MQFLTLFQINNIVRSPHPSPLPEGEGAGIAPFRAFLRVLGQAVKKRVKLG
jgi:hypothetical protein